MAFHPDITRRDDVSVALDAANAAVRLASRQMTGNAGSVTIPNADGTKTVMGVDAGDAGVAPWVGDTTAPGTPTGVSAQSGSGMIVVSWDGTLDGGVPPDFHHVALLVDGVESGRLAAKGSVVFGPYDSGATHLVSAVAYDDAHGEDGSSRPNASAPSASITVKVAGSDIDPDRLGIAITKAITDPSGDGVNKGDLWLKYDRDPDSSGAALVGEWWWNESAWVEIPVNIYLDQLASRGINADSAVIGLIAAGIITGGLFQTSADNPRSYFDTQGFHTTDADGNLTFNTSNGVVNMINAIAKNMTVTELNAVGGSMSLTPAETPSSTTIYSQTFEDSAGIEGWRSVGEAQFTISTEQHHSGSSSLKVPSSAIWASLSLRDVIPADRLLPGATYTFDYWVYFPTPSTTSIDTFNWADGIGASDLNPSRTVGWNHVTYTAKIPYGKAMGTSSIFPYMLVNPPFDSSTQKILDCYIDDLTITRTPFGAGAYFGLSDNGYPALEMYGDDGDTLISIKSSDSGSTGGKVVFATKNGVFLGTEAQQPQINITDETVGISSSNRVDITAVNDGVYVNSRKMSDSGWVDLSSYLASGVKGTFKGRVIDGVAYLALLCQGFNVSSMSTVQLANGIPSSWLPKNDFPTNAIIGSSGFFSGIVSLYLDGSDRGSIRFQNLEKDNAWICRSTLTPYALG